MAMVTNSEASACQGITPANEAVEPELAATASLALRDLILVNQDLNRRAADRLPLRIENVPAHWERLRPDRGPHAKSENRQ
jgi:hypothetical protein